MAKCVALALQYCNPQPLLSTDLLPLEFPLGLGGNKVSVTSADFRFYEVDSQIQSAAPGATVSQHQENTPAPSCTGCWSSLCG